MSAFGTTKGYRDYSVVVGVALTLAAFFSCQCGGGETGRQVGASASAVASVLAEPSGHPAASQLRAIQDSTSPATTNSGTKAASPSGSTQATTTASNGQKFDTKASQCKADLWSGYAHDVRRTSASEMCCKGPLKELWRYTPAAKQGRASLAETVVTSGDGVYVGIRLGESTALVGVDLQGQEKWVYDSRTDIHHGHWPLVAHGVVAVVDDGLFLIKPSSGKPTTDRVLDLWGQVVADKDRFYLVNTFHVEGPKAFVAAADPKGKILWRQNVMGQAPQDVYDRAGAIALDNGVLFQAAGFMYGFAKKSGVFALDPEQGQSKWSQKTLPKGDISAGSGLLFLDELTGPKLELVARDQTTGERVWSSPILETDLAAPAQSAGLLLTFSFRDGLCARNAKTGELRWRASAPEAPAKAPYWKMERDSHETSIVISEPSQTVILSAGDRVSMYSLQSGDLLFSTESLGKRAHSPILSHNRVYTIVDGAVVALGCAEP